MWLDTDGSCEMPESTAELEAYRKKELRSALEQREAAQNLVSHFDACNLEALIKVTRNALEAMKKTLSMSAVSAGKFSHDRCKTKINECRICVFFSFVLRILTVSICYL